MLNTLLLLPIFVSSFALAGKIQFFAACLNGIESGYNLDRPVTFEKDGGLYQLVPESSGGGQVRSSPYEQLTLKIKSGSQNLSIGHISYRVTEEGYYTVSTINISEKFRGRGLSDELFQAGLKRASARSTIQGAYVDILTSSNRNMYYHSIFKDCDASDLPLELKERLARGADRNTLPGETDLHEELKRACQQGPGVRDFLLKSMLQLGAKQLAGTGGVPLLMFDPKATINFYKQHVRGKMNFSSWLKKSGCKTYLSGTADVHISKTCQITFSFKCGFI